MNINSSNLSKSALKILSNIDRYLEAYAKCKGGRRPEKIAILNKDYYALYTSATKHLDKKDKPNEIYHAGVLLYPQS